MAVYFLGYARNDYAVLGFVPGMSIKIYLRPDWQVAEVHSILFSAKRVAVLMIEDKFVRIAIIFGVDAVILQNGLQRGIGMMRPVCILGQMSTYWLSRGRKS